ncbi:hypothetical protein KRR23_21760 [Pseudomonas sp. CVAP|uniref:hypothetical protein n=1 Tax=Pseudomonas TaxID=286 RepID=UPI000CD1A885|nr:MULTISPECIES: hypothetical protein [unclassified Pseudomonas]MBU6960360.1 hypothetical protein [Pseudomonas sp. CVAP\
MSEDRVVALEIALKTVMAVAGRQGVAADELCRKSIRAIISDPEFNWVKPDHAEDAIAEIEMAQAAIAHLSLPSAK